MKSAVELLRKYQSIVLLTMFLFGIVVIFWGFLASFGLGESGYNFVGKTKKVTLSPGKLITQTFTAHAPGLHQLRVVLSKAHIRSGEAIEFHLMDEGCHEPIATTTFTRKPRQQGAYIVFSFPPIPDSANRRYCFAATYQSEENRKGEKPYLSATDEPDPIFADRTLTDSNKGKIYPGQTLFLRPVYTKGGLRDDIRELENRLSQYKPAFMKGHMLTLGTFILLLSLGLYFWLVRQRD